MKGIAIYMEGGGDTTSGKAALRKGMGEFLSALRDEARKHGLRWKIVSCGTRRAAFNSFQHALKTYSDTLSLLLVDSEEAVAVAPLQHLRQRDSWNFENTGDEQVHLMVRTMETWVVADTEALTKYYGKDFNTGALPASIDLETVSKSQVAAALMRATRHTTKGAYHKVRHASDLLARIDAKKVRSRCKHCDRLFATLETKIGGAS